MLWLDPYRTTFVPKSQRTNNEINTDTSASVNTATVHTTAAEATDSSRKYNKQILALIEPVRRAAETEKVSQYRELLKKHYSDPQHAGKKSSEVPEINMFLSAYA